MKEQPVRKKLRLVGFDYSQAGYYFITICVKERREMLGKVVGAIINRPQDSATVEMTEYGSIAERAIEEIPAHYPGVVVEKYVIMPNHIHMILSSSNIENDNGRLIIAPTRVSVMIQQYKRHVSKQIGFSLWQRSYHDRIIRNEAEYLKIWQYIDENPAKWQEDYYNPERNNH